MNKYVFLAVTLTALFCNQVLFCMEISKEKAAAILHEIADARKMGDVCKQRAEKAHNEELEARVHFGQLAGQWRKQHPVPVGPSNMQKKNNGCGESLSMHHSWRANAVEWTMYGMIFAGSYLIGAKIMKRAFK